MSELALELIREAKAKHLTKLDLGKCGLTEIPEALFELVWLEELILSNEWVEHNQKKGKREQKKSANHGIWNQIEQLPQQIELLLKLQHINLSGTKISDVEPITALKQLNLLYLDNTVISDIAPLSTLKQLNSLHLDNTGISDITPLATLKQLNSLHLDNTGISDITPLATLKQLNSLHLDNTNISDITPITTLCQLTSLYLSGNQIKDIAPLAALTQLNSLYLSENQISDIEPLAALTQLNSLYLSGNQISDISPLTALTQLNSLYLSENQISNIAPLATLVSLNSLYLSRNQISDITPLSTLTKLDSLYLRNNKISDINSLAPLTNLNSLYLRGNKISNITPITTLINLNSLYLRNNKVSDITPLSTLTELNFLDLSENQISKITPLSTLTNLNSLDLRNNKISDIRPLSTLIKKGIRATLKEEYFEEKIVLAENPVEHPPREIIEQGNQAIYVYFKDLEEQGTEQLNEAKLIIVGEPNAGKTTLMETLLNPNFKLSKKTESTLGVQVREGWQFLHPYKPNTPFTCNIWDFGGQQIQHMTHQFFLTPSAVYALVSDNDRKESTNFPYWFKIIHLLGEEEGRYSPVLVVLNEKNDKFINKFNFDRKFYEERYPELQISVCEVNLAKRDSHYQALTSEIQSMLTRLPHTTSDRPASWNDIQTSLRVCAKNNDHITFDQYSSICQKHSVIDEQSQLMFSRYLHRLGSLLHFSEDLSLHNFIILNPQWAVDAVYSVLNDSQIAKNDGYFGQQQVEKIWQGKYNLDERRKLLSLMQKENFEICYPLDHGKPWYIAPQLLNVEQPNFIWDAEDNLKFRFQYKFMPEGIITRLIVRLNSIIARNPENKQLIWNKGAVFTENGCRAKVQEEENRSGLKIIDIAINGKISERKFLLRRIRIEVHELHKKWFRNIQAEQMIPCTCEYCTSTLNKDPKFFEFSVLNRAYERGKQTIECDKDFIDVPVIELLEGIFQSGELDPIDNENREPIPAPKTKSENEHPDIFISYSQKDKVYATHLVKALEARGFSVWWDNDMVPGDRFRNAIHTELVNAACVIVLWSHTALKSDWVPEEAGYAHQHNKLIPARLEPIELLPPFGGLQIANLENWHGEENHPDLQELLEAVARRTKNNR